MKPAPAFKVGDWVEVKEIATGEIEHHTVERVNTFCPVLLDYLVDDVWFNHDGMEITPLDCMFSHRRITRKLDPSEVRIKIGCLEGRVRKTATSLAFFLVPDDPQRQSLIDFYMLDIPTRELVQSLLKAQEKGDNE